MNRIIKYWFLVALSLALSAPLSAWAVIIQYGVVTGVDEVEEEDHEALVGGLLGDLIENTADAIDTDSYFHYAVELVGSGETIHIRTEQDDIDEGHCVAVEQGEYSNIRRVSAVHCEEATDDPPEHHTRIANECDEAKQQLVAAESDDELEIAIQKVRVLCED